MFRHSKGVVNDALIKPKFVAQPHNLRQQRSNGQVSTCMYKHCTCLVRGEPRKPQTESRHTHNMDRHALAILEAAESWNWPFPYQIQKSGEQIRKFKALTAKLLFCCIDESTKYSESKLVNHFWETVKLCDTGFAANSELYSSQELMLNFGTLPQLKASKISLCLSHRKNQ